MAYKLLARPKLKNPVLLACWPGIGSIGTFAIEHIRGQLKTKPLAEIEPFEYYYPTSLNIKQSIIGDLIFPASNFYYAKTPGRDIIFFIGDQQPVENNESYARGQNAYKMAH